MRSLTITPGKVRIGKAQVLKSLNRDQVLKGTRDPRRGERPASKLVMRTESGVEVAKQDPREKRAIQRSEGVPKICTHTLVSASINQRDHPGTMAVIPTLRMKNMRVGKDWPNLQKESIPSQENAA